MPNCLDMVHAIFGIALAGCVVCPLNARYRSAELAYVIESTDLAVLLTSDIVEEHVDYVPLLHEALPGLAAGDPIAARPGDRAAPPPRRAARPAHGRRACSTARRSTRSPTPVPDDAVEERRAAVRVRDPGLILTTSGTTANPKGCVITHEAIVRGSRAVGEREQIGEGEVVWAALPLFHTSGLQPLLYVLDRGGTRPLDDALRARRRRSPRSASTRATVVKSTFPPITMALVNHPDFGTIDAARVRIVQLVAPPDTLRLVMAAFPNAAVQGAYGLCEAGGYVAVNVLGEDPERRLTSEGPPFPGIEVAAFRAGRLRVRRPTSRASCASGATRSSSATTATPTGRPRCSMPTAGSTPATAARSAPTAASGSSAGSRR